MSNTPNSKYTRFISKRYNDLKILKTSLQKNLGISPDYLYPISQSSISLFNETQCKYNLRDFILPIKIQRHISPTGIEPRIRININFTIDIDKWENGEDPFLDYYFSIVLFGNMQKGNQEKTFSICWHIDKDEASSSDESHPLYHMQLSEPKSYVAIDNPFSWGDAIHLDSPRIVHYPLDLYLGLGFVIRNFYYKGDFEKLTLDSQFVSLYRESENHILKPYYYSIMRKWDPILRTSIDYHKLCPQLL